MMTLHPAVGGRWRRAGCAALVVGLAALACARDEGGSPPTLAPGAWLAGDAEALQALLGSLARLESTEVGRVARDARARLSACSHVLGHAPSVAALPAALACAEPAQVPTALRRLRGEAALVASLPIAAPGGPAIRLTGSPAADGSFVAAAELAASAPDGLASLLVPAAEPAGPPRLSGREALVHARLRPAEGLAAARAVSEGSQADRMFRLGSGLFTGAALEGTWEVVLYAPSEGATLPPMALALELALPSAARAGVDAFVRELEATWPIRHRAGRFRVAAAGERETREVDGACFPELRILPDFEPCWTVDGDVLVIGWNASSLEHALEPPSGAGSLDGLELALARWPDAERVLGGEGRAYPWSRIELKARAEGDDVHVAVRAAPRVAP